MDEVFASYENCLRAAGAEVHCFEYFGSYEGDIWCKFTIDGKTGCRRYPYGSCSGCDWLQGHFMAEDETAETIRAFGIEMLSDAESLMTDAEALAEVRKWSDWDVEADAIIAFIKENSDRA